MQATSLNAKQQLFCHYYTEGPTFGNATLSYAEAYGHNLDTEPVDKKQEHYCAVAGSRLVRNDEISARIRELLNQKMNDKAVDAQLSWLIFQRGNLSVKLAAIREYNNLRSRITKHLDHTLKTNTALAHLTDSQLQEILDEGIASGGNL